MAELLPEDYPFSRTMSHPIDLEYVQAALEYNPKYPGRKVIIDSCINGAGPGVIAFLVSRFPSAVRERDSNGNLPIHNAMRIGPASHKASLEDLTALLDAYPESLLERSTFPVNEHDDVSLYCGYNMCPLQAVLRFPYSRQVIDVFFSHFPKCNSHLSIRAKGPPVFTHERPHMNIDCVAGMQRVIPQLTSITHTVRDMNEEAFWNLLGSLYGNKRMARVALTIPLLAAAPNTYRSTAALLISLVGDRAGTQLESFSLSWEGDLPPMVISYFLTNFPTVGKPFRTLTLSESILVDAASLSTCLMHLNSPIALVLHNLVIWGDFGREYSLANCRLRKLLLTLSHNYPKQWTCGLVSQLYQVPSLRKLRIDFRLSTTLAASDFTPMHASLASLMSKQPSPLRILIMDYPNGLVLNAQALLDVLPHNTVLETFVVRGNLSNVSAGCQFILNTLREANMALQRVLYGPYGTDDPRQCIIDYYTDWNHAGRQSVGNPSTPIRVLCDLFADSKAVITAQARYVSILFELLRQSSATWASLSS